MSLKVVIAHNWSTECKRSLHQLLEFWCSFLHSALRILRCQLWYSPSATMGTAGAGKTCGSVIICDWNPACRESAQVMQCAFLVPQVESCQSPVLSYSCQRTFLLTFAVRVNVTYQGEISLHFDLPSLYSCHTQCPLLRVLIRIPVRRLSRHS